MMTNGRVDISDKTAVSMPMRNLLAILSAVGVGVWAFFGIQARLNTLETRNTLMEADLVENTAFRIGWPRGEMGSLPADSEQFMLLEYQDGMIVKLQKQVEAMMHNAVNIKRLQEDMKEARENIEKLKDKLREANGG
jgi:succinate dehydrogenase/fumarate reductase flavoprotein subunit|tara:strand:- start:32 stop:442 length:411 start_codon:yes stop_codon:yes gene_type:complete